MPGMVKYGLDDARPILERASARETAARVAVGALARLLLAEFGIAVGSYVTEIGGVVADVPDLPHDELWALAEASDVRCPDEAAAAGIRAAIDAARAQGDSLGGVLCRRGDRRARGPGQPRPLGAPPRRPPGRRRDEHPGDQGRRDRPGL